MKLTLSACAALGLASLFGIATACGGSSAGVGAGGTGGSAGDPGGSGSETGSADAGSSSTSSPSSPSAPGSPSSPTPTADGGTVSTGDGGDAGAPLSRKRGIAYGSNTEADLAALSAGIGWWYNWSASPDSTLPKNYASSGVEFVPMIWGGTFDATELATQVPAGAKYLLTFNEPNFGAQSNLTPQQAAALWPQVEAFATSRGLAIVSPALNYCGGSCNETNPFTWLDDFFAACTGCRVDYVAAHWYSCTKGALQTYLDEYETKYDKPLWLTEFSCLDGSLAENDANEASYMKDALALLEADPKVFRYSWFTGRSSTPAAIDLLADAGTLTALGKDYVTLPEGP